MQAFQNEFDLQPAAFKTAAHAFHDAGYALGSYALSMDSARKAAALALEVFQRGVRAARDAHAAASAASAGLLPTSGPLDLRSQPAGLQDRLTGIEKLDAARHQLDRAGSDAARMLRDAMALAPRQVTTLQHAANFFATNPSALLNQEKVDFAAGGARAAADMTVLAATVAMPTPRSVLGMNHLESQLDDLERKHGVNPRSGWHTGGSILLPAVASPGIGAFLSRLGSKATTALAPKAALEVAGAEASAYASALRAAEGRTPTAAAASVDRKSGSVFTGHSAEAVDVPAPLRALLPDPTREPWSATNCAEVAAASKALQSGARLEDLTFYTVRTKSGQYFPPCANCSTWLPGATQ